MVGLTWGVKHATQAAKSTALSHTGYSWRPLGRASGALVSPLYQSATFCFDTAQSGGRRFAGEEEGYIYTRLGNPTVAELERRLALLEGAEAAAAAASGMGAVSAALLAYLSCGDHLLASSAVYGCTFSLMTEQFARFGIEVSLVDFADLAAVEAAIRPNTRVISANAGEPASGRV